MRKVFLFALTLAVTVSVFAQNRMLSSNQLMNRNLYPSAPLKSIQFVGNSDLLAYYNDTAILIGNEKKMDVLVLWSDLREAMKTAGVSSVSSMFDITVLGRDQLTFFANQGQYSYDVKHNKVSLLADCGHDRYGLWFDHDRRNYAYSDEKSFVVVVDGTPCEVAVNSADVVYGQSVHRNEFGIDGGIFWSPKDDQVAFYRMDQSMVTNYPMVNTHTRIASPAPFKYPMAGMKSHEVTLGVFNVVSKTIHYLETRRDTSVDERENYLTNVTWSPDGKFIYIAKVNRAQNHMWLERYVAASGKLDKVLFEEQNSRYVEPCEGLFFVPDHPDQFVWLSMRDGYKHLYLYDTEGNMLKQLTHGNYEVEGIVGFDSKNIYIYANKDNLAGKAFYRVSMKNGEMTLLTSKEGTHKVVMNRQGTRFVDTYSSVGTPSRCVLLDAKGREQKVLFEVSNPLADYAMPGIKLGTIKAADGSTDLYYRLITPPGMDSSKQYPTLVYVYGGPHSQLVTDSWLAGGNLYFTFLAQQGYVVFTLDNRGTDNRGFEFESCTHRQLGTIEMSDQMEGVKFLQSLPYVDKDRMGVEGWSFGGFMTITMKLAHPEIFKVACAGGPVIDWKWYEVMYGERYMDTPQENPEGYANASLLSKAKDLEGRLLVIHGAEDNTVVWQNSIEFIERCINNGKLVDYFIYPHHEHNVQGRERVHLYEKMFDYYETYLK